MSAIPDDEAHWDDDWERSDWGDADWGDEAHDWDDEFNRHDWRELTLIEENERRDLDWWHWAGQMLLVALLLPVMMGLLVWILILIF